MRALRKVGHPAADKRLSAWGEFSVRLLLRQEILRRSVEVAAVGPRMTVRPKSFSEDRFEPPIFLRFNFFTKSIPYICRMKILIVEDEPSLREVMQRALRQEGYVVETAATYAEADRRVSGYDYDCILLDIMLPDGNGLRLLERIKGLRR